MGHRGQPDRPPGSGRRNRDVHLLGAQLGGSNKDPRNFVTMHQYANTPAMRDFETQVRKAVDAGEIIRYRATPAYSGSVFCRRV
ncbi:DNA/RNA non-specific endonuclease [Kitasatospora sp. NPDC085879]|uniref:DNA/RNA non-specific endonuclease n=1 Tax=Kitasatospora sp. NPDC085879 TaxID=3154769 RepID=UPI00344028C4